MGDTVKISANLAPEVVETIKELAKKRGISMTELLRRAVAVEKFLDEEIERGSTILIETREKELRQLVRH